MKVFYDVVTKQDIIFEDGKFKSKCIEMGLDHTQFNHVVGNYRKKQLHCYKRYILPRDKDKIFTLIEVDTGKEYDCIATLTLEIHLNCKLTMNEVKFVYELLRERQKFATIQGKVFYLKGGKDLNICTTRTKGKSTVIDALKRQQRLYTKITNRIRGRIGNAIRAYKAKKYNRSEKLLGCSMEFVFGYLESQFKPNMTWDNYGTKWHIDHIKPCCDFDLTKEEEQYKCFNYTNLRPLWATTEIAREFGDMESIGNLNRLDQNRKIIIDSGFQSSPITNNGLL